MKLPNTCNRRETVQKGAMKLPYRLHKVLLYYIIRICALDFIEHDKGGHQDEEEDSKNDVPLLSSDEVKE